MHNASYTCPSCQTSFPLRFHKRTRLLFGIASGVIGTAASESLLVGAIIGTCTYSLAALLDERRAYRCPACYRVSLPARRPQRAGPEPERQREAEREEERLHAQPSPSTH